MNIHEYQARELFEQFGVATSKGRVATTPEEAMAAARGLGTDKIMVKAQIHAGGRGKGTFTNGFKGGVHLCETPEKAREVASQMLGQTLVTHQTGPEGKLVGKVLVAEAVDIARELYFAILMDRASSAPIVIASTEGGMDIEAVAEKTPEKIFRESIHPTLGLQAYQTRKLASALGLNGKLMAQAGKLFSAMFKLFVARDCSQIEVRIILETSTGSKAPLRFLTRIAASGTCDRTSGNNCCSAGVLLFIICGAVVAICIHLRGGFEFEEIETKNDLRQPEPSNYSGWRDQKPAAEKARGDYPELITNYCGIYLANYRIQRSFERGQLLIVVFLN